MLMFVTFLMMMMFTLFITRNSCRRIGIKTNKFLVRESRILLD